MSVLKWLNPGRWLGALQSSPPEVRTGLFRGLCIVTPLLLFVTFFNPYILDPTRIGWTLVADWGQHVLGWNAFRHVSWASFNHEDLLYHPAGLSVIYTDSNPLFAFIFKPLRAFLPEQFQYIGIWFLFCVCMHFLFAYKLVKPHAPNRWAAYAGALALSALPCLYYRMRHDTLMAQWLILWGLHLFINVRDGAPQVALSDITSPFRRFVARLAYVLDAKTRGWMALLGLCGLIHPYLLFMVAAIWGGDVLRVFWPAARAMDRRTLFYTALRAAIVFACPLITLGISGAYAQGQSPGAGGFGYYSTGLDSFFNPVLPEFSAILKAWPQSPGQAFEGYQYLGFGLLVLIGAAIILYITTSEAKEARVFFVKLKPLTLPFIVLGLIALSNHWQFYGYTVFKFAVPDPLKAPLAVLRASGRFFWPMAYCGVLGALVVIYKCRPRTMAVVLPAILVLQAYDLNGFAEIMRQATARSASTRIYDITLSPTWDKLLAQSNGIDFYPANVHLNDRLFYELTWRATTAGKSVNTMYPARENITQIANEDAGEDAFRRGEVHNDRLFVFLKQCDAPPELQPLLRMVDGVWIIPPDAARNMPLDKPVWTPISAKVRFGWLDQGPCLVDGNWSKPDIEGVWSKAPAAEVVIPIQHIKFDTAQQPQALDLNLRFRAHKPVVVNVLVNGTKVSEINLSHQASEHSIPLPSSVLRKENMRVRFEIETPLDQAVAVAETQVKTSGRNGPVEAKTVVVNPGLAIKLLNMNLVERGSTPAPVPRPAISG